MDISLGVPQRSKSRKPEGEVCAHVRAEGADSGLNCRTKDLGGKKHNVKFFNCPQRSAHVGFHTVVSSSTDAAHG